MSEHPKHIFCDFAKVSGLFAAGVGYQTSVEQQISIVSRDILWRHNARVRRLLVKCHEMSSKGRTPLRRWCRPDRH